MQVAKSVGSDIGKMENHNEGRIIIVVNAKIMIQRRWNL